MVCPKCKKVAFPIELRCLKCDAVLTGVPPAFEVPSERASAPPVFCGQCGAKADDARIACISCKSTLPRPITLNPAEGEEFDDDLLIDRYEIVCMDEACEECKKVARKPVPFVKVKSLVVPVPSCLHPVCWCMVMGTGGGK